MFSYADFFICQHVFLKRKYSKSEPWERFDYNYVIIVGKDHGY